MLTVEALYLEPSSQEDCILAARSKKKSVVVSCVHKHREGLGTNSARKFLRILIFLVRKVWMNPNRALNFLVIKEVFSSSIGAVVVSEDKMGKQQLISKWFGELGLRNSAGSLEFCRSFCCPSH